MDLLERIIGEFQTGAPTITTDDALLALNLGLWEISEILFGLRDGTISVDDARRQLGPLIPGFPTGLTPTQEDILGADWDRASIERAIGQLWSHLGIDPLRSQVGPLGGVQFGAGPGYGLPGVLGQLGVGRPQLFRNSETGQVFLLQQGKLHAVTTPGLASASQLERMGITNPQDIISVTPEVLEQFGGISDPLYYGPDFNLQEMLPVAEGRWPTLAQPIVEPVTGLVLPAPRAVAGLLPQLPPTIRQLVYDAYQLAGYSPADVEAERMWFTPFGTATPGGVRLG